MTVFAADRGSAQHGHKEGGKAGIHHHQLSTILLSGQSPSTIRADAWQNPEDVIRALALKPEPCRRHRRRHRILHSEACPRRSTEQVFAVDIEHNDGRPNCRPRQGRRAETNIRASWPAKTRPACPKLSIWR